MKSLLRLSSFIVCVALSATFAHAAVKFLDVNGTVAGSGTTGGSTYTWNSATTAWNTDSAGGAAGALSAWTSNAVDAAVFSAGADGTGEFTVNIPSVTGAGFITNEEGIVNLTGSALTVSNINIKSGATLSYVSAGAIVAATGSRMNISGGTFRCNNPGVGGTFLPTAMAMTLGTGGGTLSVDGASTAISIYGGVISGTG